MNEQIAYQHTEIEYDPIGFVWRCAKCKKIMPIKEVWANALRNKS